VIVYPAIDLKQGEVVRLKQGDMDQATVYGSDPAKVAKGFEETGFAWVHVVDLDGAFAGQAMNLSAVEAVLDAVSIPVQLGGGIRTMDAVEGWLTRGISRVILGTAAVRDPDFVRRAAKEFPGKVAVGIDARGGKVAVEGWAEVSELTALDLAKRFEDAGIAAIIYTDIGRDGLLKGLDIDGTRALAEAVSIPVIASGGLAGIADIKALLEPENRIISGTIAGRALYDGRLDAKAALSLIRETA